VSRGSEALDYFARSSSYIKAHSSTNQSRLDLLVKHKAQEEVHAQAQLALDEWKEAQEVKIAEQQFKLSLAKVLLNSADPELQAAAKKKLLDALEK